MSLTIVTQNFESTDDTNQSVLSSVRRARPAEQNAAYRRLAAAILGLDVTSLATQLQASRQSAPTPHALCA